MRQAENASEVDPKSVSGSAKVVMAGSFYFKSSNEVGSSTCTICVAIHVC